MSTEAAPTITEFLLARIAEDEAVAKRAAFGWGADWESAADDDDEWFLVNTEGKNGMVGCEDADVINHIAAHGPARLLSECAAKQAIIAEHSPVDPCDAHDADYKTIACDTLRALAAVYADHPDYKQEWAL